MERWLPGVNFCRRLVVDCRHWRWINFCGRTCAFVHLCTNVHGYMGNYVHHHQVHHVHVPPCTPCAIMYTITMFIMYMCTTRVPPSPLILLRSCLIRQMRSGHSFYGECELIANDDFNMVFCFVFNWIKMLHILVLISCSPCLTKSSSIKDSKLSEKRRKNFSKYLWLPLLLTFTGKELPLTICNDPSDPRLSKWPWSLISDHCDQW